MDAILQIVEIFYAIVALLFAFFTMSEHAKNRHRQDICKMAGVVACAVWPIVLMLALVEVRIARKYRLQQSSEYERI
jgi:hypothetical protein